jgi:hypothetical protein
MEYNDYTPSDFTRNLQKVFSIMAAQLADVGGLIQKETNLKDVINIRRS